VEAASRAAVSLPAPEPSTTGVGTRSEDADAIWGPVGCDGSSDDPSGGDGAPEPAVVGFATVVPHHEPVSGRNLDGRREVALGTGPARADVGVVLALAVAD